jgi:hypothetical protein
VDYKVRINTTWSAADSSDIVEITELERNATFRMACDNMFNFGGLILTFNPLKGIISIHPAIAAEVTVNGSQWNLQQQIYNRTNTYTALNGPGGLVGTWNHDEADERILTFEDNNRVPYATPLSSIFLRRYLVGNTSTYATYTENVGQKTVFENLVLTKIND